MSQRMIDAAYPPMTTAALQAIDAAMPFDVLAVYVPWGAPEVNDFPNPYAAAMSALHLGKGLHLILDPNHPSLGSLNEQALKVGIAYAVQFIQKLGPTPSQGSVSLDIEEGDWANPSVVERVAGWFHQDAPAAGIGTAVQYGNPNVLTGLAGLSAALRPEVIWAADYTASSVWPSSVASIPGLADSMWSGPNQRGWQWQGGVKVAGYGLDFSLIDFPVYSLNAPTPTPTPSPSPAPTGISLVAGQSYVTPRGDVLVVDP